MFETRSYFQICSNGTISTEDFHLQSVHIEYVLNQKKTNFASTIDETRRNTLTS